MNIPALSIITFLIVAEDVEGKSSIFVVVRIRAARNASFVVSGSIEEMDVLQKVNLAGSESHTHRHLP